MHVGFSVKRLAVGARCHLPVSVPNVGNIRTALYAPVRKSRLTVDAETGFVAAVAENIGGSRQRAAAVTTCGFALVVTAGSACLCRLRHGRNRAGRVPHPLCRASGAAMGMAIPKPLL